MADMVLLKIGTTDVTGYVDRQNFTMNRVDVYDEWTDGNVTDHRVICRRRFKGKAALGFSKAADFSAFCALIESERQTDGYFSVTAYVNNTGTTETFQAYIDITATAKWDWLNSRQWQVMTLTITQR